jgi:taurine dioxygenase
MSSHAIGRVEVVPSGAALGAEIGGVNLSTNLSSDVRDTIRAAWHEHLVIVFRDQRLTDQQLVNFGRCFGEVLEDNRLVDYDRSLDTDIPEMVDVVSNVAVNGTAIGALGDGEAIWHTDTQPVPNSALILHALEIPGSGGNTRFGNMYAAYEGLPAELKRKVEWRASIHDRVYGLQQGQLFHSSVMGVPEKSQMPGPWYPIVRTHGETGRKALHLQKEGSGFIVGLPEKESDEILARLWAHMTRPEFIWEHRWKVGDVVVWDNRCTIHSRGAFDPNARRRLHRITIRGEWPH